MTILSLLFAAMVTVEASSLGVKGRGFEDAAPYARLPERMLPHVSKKLRMMHGDATGLYVEFKTNSKKLAFDWELANPNISDAKICTSGLQGIDIYGRGTNGVWRFVTLARVRNPGEATHHLEIKWPADTVCRAYLPFRGQVKSLRISHQEGTALEPVTTTVKRVMHYGTSLVHGGCVPRSGLVFTSIYGRLADAEVVNLGFSGAAKLEPELPAYLAEVKADLYVVDAALNNSAKELDSNLEPFLRDLIGRVAPKPVLLCEPASTFEKVTDRSLATRRVYGKLKAEGCNIHLIRTDELMADDSEGTVDGTHPNAWGAIQIGRAFAGKVRQMLPADPSPLAQDMTRPRPSGWDQIVPGGRFIDRFDRSPDAIGGTLVSDCWGGDNVKPRDVRNGMEDPKHSYWGGNITKVGREYHLFVARWPESVKKGHSHWPNSEIAHCVSGKPNGDFKVVEVLGGGHNPELFRCKDGSWAVYCIDAKGKAHLYRAVDLNGPWAYGRMPLDDGGYGFLQGESNFSFCTRPDGSILAVCRGGGIWVSEDGVKPFVQQTAKSVYPRVTGRFEDPVIWRDGVCYHLIVNDWLGRVAWYLVSPDGIHDWKVQPGEAYTPGIAPQKWYKFERPRVLQDDHGRVVQMNFAVIDCPKKEDRGGDIHSSKNICLPVNPGRMIRSVRLLNEGWEVRFASEPGFKTLTDIDSASLSFGTPEMVAFGKGFKPVRVGEKGGELCVIFPFCDFSGTILKVLGREKDGRLFFALAAHP